MESLKLQRGQQKKSTKYFKTQFLVESVRWEKNIKSEKSPVRLENPSINIKSIGTFLIYPNPKEKYEVRN